MYETIIKKLIKRDSLTSSEVEGLFEEMLSGQLAESQIAALLTALKMKSVSPDELLGLVRTVLKHAQPFSLPQTFNPQPSTLLDVCGTGGDHSGTFNVSTITAVVCAAAGVSVVKHGNRAATSKCGSFDLLEAASIIALNEPDMQREISRLQKYNIAFLFAPFFHPSLKVVAPVRKALGFPTVFNILGPLVNPARPTRQMIGIAKPELAELMGQVAIELGSEKVIFVHGLEGLDEVSVSGSTEIVEYTKGVDPRRSTISPSDLGIGTYPIEQLKGGDIQENVKIVEAIMNNTATDAQRDFVLANSGVALYVSGRVNTIKEGVELAREVLASGKAGELWMHLKGL